MLRELIPAWTLAILLTAAAVGITLAGFNLAIGFKTDTGPFIDDSALPAGAPRPHAHCNQQTAAAAVMPHLAVKIHPQDRAPLMRTLQEYAYRMGGCYNRDYLTLPKWAIPQIQTLTSGNYATQVTRILAEARPQPQPETELRQIRLRIVAYRTYDHRPDWQVGVGALMMIIGSLIAIPALLAILFGVDETVAARRNRRCPPPAVATAQTS